MSRYKCPYSLWTKKIRSLYVGFIHEENAILSFSFHMENALLEAKLCLSHSKRIMPFKALALDFQATSILK